MEAELAQGDTSGSSRYRRKASLERPAKGGKYGSNDNSLKGAVFAYSATGEDGTRQDADWTEATTRA